MSKRGKRGGKRTYVEQECYMEHQEILNTIRDLFQYRCGSHGEPFSITELEAQQFWDMTPQESVRNKLGIIAYAFACVQRYLRREPEITRTQDEIIQLARQQIENGIWYRDAFMNGELRQRREKEKIDLELEDYFLAAATEG